MYRMCSQRPTEGWGKRCQDCWGRAWLWLRSSRERKNVPRRPSRSFQIVFCALCYVWPAFDERSVQFLLPLNTSLSCLRHCRNS